MHNKDAGCDTHLQDYMVTWSVIALDSKFGLLIISMKLVVMDKTVGIML